VTGSEPVPRSGGFDHKSRAQEFTPSKRRSE